MRSRTVGKRAIVEFDDMHDFVTNTKESTAIQMYRENPREEFTGVRSVDEAFRLAENGIHWDAKDLNLTGELAESVGLPPLPGPVWDVTGCDVDVSRFLSGEPECMLDFQVAERTARIATIAVGVNTPGSVSTAAIKRRGEDIVSLLAAVQGVGIQTELWADVLLCGDDCDYTGRIMVKVNSPGEILDPDIVMFAMTHPAMFRVLGFSAMHHFPGKWKAELNVRTGGGYGYNYRHTDLSDYPEGSVLIPVILKDGEAATIIPDTLRKLALIPERPNTG